MKGVSEIIATILVLMITIGLAGTAFIYIQSSLTGRAGKSIDVLDVTCASGGSGSVSMVIKNLDPKSPILNTEINTFINGQIAILVQGTWPASIAAGATAVGSCTVASGCIASTSVDPGDAVSARVVGPTNAVSRDVVC